MTRCDACAGSGWKLYRATPLRFARCFLCQGAGTLFAYMGVAPFPSFRVSGIDPMVQQVGI